MLIAHFLRFFIAVLSLAAVFSPAFVSSHEHHFTNESLVHHSSKHSKGMMYEWYESFYNSSERFEHAGEFLSVRDNQMVLKRESEHHEHGAECCPAILEMVEPKGGKNQDDKYVELYQEGNIVQRFYELSCHQDFLNRPCRFMDRKLHNSSKCVQKYSYTYALVKDPGHHSSSSGGSGSGSGHHHKHRTHHHQHQLHHQSNFGSIVSNEGGQLETRWTLDYIQIRSGCSCVVQPNMNKRMLAKRYKNRRRHKGPPID